MCLGKPHELFPRFGGSTVKYLGAEGLVRVRVFCMYRYQVLHPCQQRSSCCQQQLLPNLPPPLPLSHPGTQVTIRCRKEKDRRQTKILPNLYASHCTTFHHKQEMRSHKPLNRPCTKRASDPRPPAPAPTHHQHHL